MSIKHLQVPALLAVSTLLAACHYQPTPVPLRGAAADIAKLAGEWEGRYSSGESQRSGIIVFTIRAGSDTALGDVVMTPQYGQPLRAADVLTNMHALHETGPELLRVAFVRIEGGLMRGELEPYIAPDCHCTVTTVFRGAVNGDRIDGSYVTRGPRDLLQEGTWSVERRKGVAGK